MPLNPLTVLNIILADNMQYIVLNTPLQIWTRWVRGEGGWGFKVSPTSGCIGRGLKITPPPLSQGAVRSDRRSWEICNVCTRKGFWFSPLTTPFILDHDHLNSWRGGGQNIKVVLNAEFIHFQIESVKIQFNSIELQNKKWLWKNYKNL